MTFAGAAGTSSQAHRVTTTLADEAERVVNVTGDSNITTGGDLIVGGDLTYYSSSEREDFTELKLREYTPPTFPCTTCDDVLVNALHQHRVIVLTGSAGADISELARHVAWAFCEKLRSESGAAAYTLPTLEWYRSSDIQRLLLKLHKTQVSTIFLLADVSDRDLSAEDFRRIQRTDRHYIIISTNCRPQDWEVSEHMRQAYWFDLSGVQLFTPQELAETLVQRLSHARDAMPPGLVENAADRKPLDRHLTALDVAGRLKTLNRVLLFVQELRGKSSIIAGSLDSLVEEIVRRDQVTLDKQLERWYRGLNSRARSLALNASFFTGLYDEQFFAALEQLMAQVWRQRDSQQAAYDYGDLADLELFFTLTETNTGGRIVEARIPKQREILFRAAWNTSRRQILAALPELAHLVRCSIHNRASHRDLFASKARSDLFRDAVSSTLSDIGMIDPSAVERALLILIADETISVQGVAAAALARWHYFGEDQQLYQLIQRWRNDTRVAEMVDDILQERSEKPGRNSQAYLRAAVALTIGHAGMHDPPNQLAPVLCDLFVQVSRDQNSFVRNRFRNYTLPMIITRHLQRVKRDLYEMTIYRELNRAIAKSLSLAYTVTPTDVVRILRDWLEETQPKRSSTSPRDVTLRETVLATIAYTYGEIDYSENNGPLTEDRVFKALQHFLKTEQHPYVRKAVILALGLQAGRNFARIDRLLQKSLAEINPQEHDDIIREFTSIYRKQRAEMQGTDDYVIVDQKRYPVWLSSASATLTDIEISLLRWVQDNTNPQAQRIAVRSQVSFETYVNRHIRVKTAELMIERHRQAMASATSLDELTNVATALSVEETPSWFVDQFLTWWVTWDAPSYRRVVGSILPEVLKQHRSNQEAMNAVLEAWKRIGDSDMFQIASRLKRAVENADKPQRFIVIAIAVIVVLLLLFLCMSLVLRAVRGA